MATNRRQKRKRELEIEHRSTPIAGRSGGINGYSSSNGYGGSSASSPYSDLSSSRKLTKRFSAFSLQRHAQTNMTGEEQRELSSLLKQYKRKQLSLEQLVNSLKIILDTPAKRQAILSIRNEVPSREVSTFDKLVITQRLWPPNAAASSSSSSRPVSPSTAFGEQPRPRSHTSSAPSSSRPVHSPSRQVHSPASWFSREANSFRQEKVKPIKITISPDVEGLLGFSVRGGSDHGLGIFVCSVDEDSEAYEKGIRVGHVIRKANGVSFERITQENAIEVLTDGSVRKIRLTVLPLATANPDGMVGSPGANGSSKHPVLYYTWVNKHGRSTSPPPEYRSGIDLLHPNASLPRSNMKKLNMAKEDSRSLGITIRGGSEHGLGVYVSQVQRNSTAHSHGLQVGDQIIDVNGVSFLNILHNEAAEMLRENEMLVMTLRSLGKVPERPIIPFDNIRKHKRKSLAYLDEHASAMPSSSAREQPVAVPERFPAVPKARRGLFVASQEPVLNNRKQGKSGIKHKESAVFKQGFGTQLMFKGFQHAVHQSSRASITQQAKAELSRVELETLNYYLDEYGEHKLTVRQLVNALIILLDTVGKKRLLNSIRTVVQPKDIDEFEKLVAPVEYQAMKDSHLAGGSSEALQNGGVIDHYQFGTSTFGHTITTADDDDNGTEDDDAPGPLREDGEGRAAMYQTDDSDSIDCNPSLSHQNSQMIVPMTASQQLAVEDQLHARLGSLLAVESEQAMGERMSRGGTLQYNERMVVNEVDEILEGIEQLETDSDSASIAGEYDVAGRTEPKHPNDVGIATASSTIHMVQMAPKRGTIPQAPPLPPSLSPVSAGKDSPLVHPAVQALKPPSSARQAQAESPFVERRDSPRKIVQSHQGQEGDRAGTLDGAALDIPLFTSTPLHGVTDAGDGLAEPSDISVDMASNDRSEASEAHDALVDTVRQRRLRIQPESTGNIQSLLGETAADETDATLGDGGTASVAIDNTDTRTETTILPSDAGFSEPVSTSTSFDLPDGVNLQTTYVYNDTSEIGPAEIRYTDTEF